MNAKTGLWIYCLIETGGDLQWNCLGIHGTSPVFTVASGAFAAVVSAEPMKKYPLVRDYLMAHQKVNEVVLKTRPVLPVRFCTIAENREKIIEEVLIPKATEFRRRFAELRCKEECGLRVRWKDLDKVMREIGETNEKVLKKKELIQSLADQERRTELIDIGHLVQSALQEKKEKMAELLMDALTPLAVNGKKNNAPGDSMILNSAFLVEKAKQSAFDAMVNTLDEKYGEALQFKYVGPVPPFNFVEIVIRWKEETSPAPREEEYVSIG